MNDPLGRSERAVAVVGIAAILPDAPDAAAFWANVKQKRYCISEVPAERWSVADYYDPDPAAPDKTYSKIGGWVRGFEFDWKRFHIPPRVAALMDESQRWAVTIADAVLLDYGHPTRPLDTERTGVVLGAAMGGEMHDLTTLRICFPEFARALSTVSGFRELPVGVRQAILARWHEAVAAGLPPITEDTMPGELANIISGRVSNLLNLRGPNFIADAACASTFAALDAAVDLLVERHCDAVITGGVDRNMGVSTFVKFCKIGALSATGTRPFGDGADGFVMGEGAAAFLLKRLADAERDGDRVYAVIRGVGGASDGRGKGITAPNPVGQRLATRRAWQDASLDPATAGLIEAHGTSTRVGDVVEVESLQAVFGAAPPASIALGSVKSNIGHLKAGAGAAGLLKAVLAVHEKLLPPTLNAEKPNPAVDFAATPFVVNHELREWPRANGRPRRAGVSAYGFGGTNFHVVLEEHVPGLLTSERKASVAVGTPAPPAVTPAPPRALGRAPLRGIAALGADSIAALRQKAEALLARATEGVAPPLAPPSATDLRAPERLVLDYDSAAQLADRLQRALKALASTSPAAWRRLQGQGIFRGSGPRAGRLAFLFPGQGSQYLNMGRALAAHEPVVKAVFDEADRVLAPALGRSLTSLLWADPKNEGETKAAETALMQTAVTQPAVLSVDAALARLLGEFGIRPDVVMGHSLGEYAAHVAASVLPLADALEAAAARGREMTRVSLDDNGCMAAVMAPLEVVEQTLATVDGYVVAANINSRKQCVIGGATAAVERAVEVFGAAGYTAQRLPVSHAFHTKIVAPASAPLRQVLDRLRVSAPAVKVVSNVTGGFYPDDVDAIKELLERQVASPVQWVKGLETAYAEGVRTFVEVGPKRVLKGFADDVFEERADVVTVYTNHTKPNEIAAFNYALCALYAAGHGVPDELADTRDTSLPPAVHTAPVASGPDVAMRAPVADAAAARSSGPGADASEAGLDAIGRMLQEALARVAPLASRPYDRDEPPLGSIVVSGTGLGLPGAEKPVMDPSNAERILRGEQFVDLVPERYRRLLANKQVTRVVKSEDGSGHFETIDDTADVIKLAGRPGSFDLAEEYGVSPKLIEAFDTTTQLAMAAGLDALREAGIPLVQTYRKTTTGKYLPDRWLLPEALRDDTGVVFASAFPGYERFADELTRYHVHEARRELRRVLEDLRLHTSDAATLAEIQRKLGEVEEQLAREPYAFDRRFLFRVLNMGHSQFAEYVGARGPNASVNAACASTAQGIALAEDWIRSGRCRRVVVIGADNVTSPRLFEWIGSGFLATGAAATDDKIEDAALPFDRRRHGTLLGMGACALVVESQDALEERGMRGIVELLASEARNSAYHATRLDVRHIADVVDSLITAAERRFGISRMAIAPQTVFVSHETFTPARGGSAAAEVEALRKVFGAAASEIVVANTKGFTGHPMGVGIEDVIGVKILEHGIVPPVPNHREFDPALGRLKLSRGGRYPVRYAIHLAAGFGSQIALTLTRRIPGGPDRVDARATYERWLADVSGYERAAAEVVKRVLRVASQGAPPRPPAPSPWRHGTGPSRRAPVADGPGVFVPPVSPGPPAVTTPGLSTPPEGPPRPTAQASASPAPAPVSHPGAATPVVAPAEAAFPEAARSAAPATAGAASVRDEIGARVLAIVADKTGYPPEMLEMDLDLEADLGVDTVKQAETFAAVREAYAIPRQESLKLRDFPTLKHVVQFVLDNRPDLAATAPATQAIDAAAAAAPGDAPTAARSLSPSAPMTAAAAQGGLDAVSQKVLAIVADKTGYPPEMLEMDLDLEADLGVDTVKQAETFAAVREAYAIPRQESLKLRDFPTLKHVVQFVLDNRPDLAATAPATQAIDAAAAAAPGDAPAVTRSLSPSAPMTAAAAQGGLDAVSQKVLAIVADKTGYPPEMLEMDLDLEADLGVDTVKQAETFAAVREAYAIPRQESLKLRDFPTLKHVVQFVLDNRPDLLSPPDGAPRPDAVPLPPVPHGSASAATAASATANPAASPAPAPTAPAPRPPRPQAYPLENADRFPRRVPVPSLRPTLELCRPTGVALAAGSRVVVAGDTGGVAAALVRELERRGVTVVALDATDPAAVAERLAGVLAEGPVHGVYWLSALDSEPALAAMDLAQFRAANTMRVKSLHAAMRTLYESVAAPGTFLVSGTRMGGLFGCGPEPATAPLGGSVQGFSKAYKRERDDALVKVVDFAPEAPPETVAAALVAETQADPGVVEVGYADGRRYTLTLEERAARDGAAGVVLGPDSVFLVTGAAGGITSAIVADLAAASGGTFHLVDLAPLPAADDPHVALLRRDRERLKLALIAEAKARGDRPLPPAIEKQILDVERQEAARRAVEAVEAAAGTAVYHSVNLLDGAAVARVVDAVRERHGRIDVLIHAGGIEVSRDLPQKDAAEFARVFDIKADGFFSLLKAAASLPIGASLVFSSIAGRFGNAGQTDYAAANALLCALTSHLRGLRPELRAVAVDWTAWAGIGMATRGSIPKIMEAAGIEMLPPEVGIPSVRRELTGGGGSGEVVVAGRLGVMGAEWEAAGGLDCERANAALAARPQPLLMVGRLLGARLYGGLEAETTLDPRQQPFLYDHALDGTPILPGVMATEAFAEIASVLVPDLTLVSVEDVVFDKPFKFYRNEPASFRLAARAGTMRDGEIVVETRLFSLIQPRPEVAAVAKTHFRACVRLARKAPRKLRVAFKKPAPRSLDIGQQAIYSVYFHGPAYRVVERAAVDGNVAIGLLARGLPPHTAPPTAAELVQPRLVELCFQTAGLWEIARERRLALPRALRAVRLQRAGGPASRRRLWAVAERQPDGSFTTRVVDDSGEVLLELVGYTTVTLEEGRSLPT